MTGQFTRWDSRKYSWCGWVGEQERVEGAGVWTLTVEGLHRVAVEGSIVGGG